MSRAPIIFKVDLDKYEESLTAAKIAIASNTLIKDDLIIFTNTGGEQVSTTIGKVFDLLKKAATPQSILGKLAPAHTLRLANIALKARFGTLPSYQEEFFEILFNALKDPRSEAGTALQQMIIDIEKSAMDAAEFDTTTAHPPVITLYANGTKSTIAHEANPGSVAVNIVMPDGSVVSTSAIFVLNIAERVLGKEIFERHQGSKKNRDVLDKPSVLVQEAYHTAEVRKAATIEAEAKLEAAVATAAITEATAKRTGKAESVEARAAADAKIAVEQATKLRDVAHAANRAAQAAAADAEITDRHIKRTQLIIHYMQHEHQSKFSELVALCDKEFREELASMKRDTPAQTSGGGATAASADNDSTNTARPASHSRANTPDVADEQAGAAAAAVAEPANKKVRRKVVRRVVVRKKLTTTTDNTAVAQNATVTFPTRQQQQSVFAGENNSTDSDNDTRQDQTAKAAATAAANSDSGQHQAITDQAAAGEPDHSDETQREIAALIEVALAALAAAIKENSENRTIVANLNDLNCVLILCQEALRLKKPFHEISSTRSIQQTLSDIEGKIDALPNEIGLAMFKKPNPIKKICETHMETTRITIGEIKKLWRKPPQSLAPTTAAAATM